MMSRGMTKASSEEQWRSKGGDMKMKERKEVTKTWAESWIGSS